MISFRLVDFSGWTGLDLRGMLADFLPIPIVYAMLAALAILLSFAAYLVLSDD